MTERRPVTIVRRLLPPLDRPRVSVEDVKLTALLPLLFAVSWLVPERHWQRVCEFLAGPPREGSADAVTRGIELSGLTVPMEMISHSLKTHRFLSYLQYLRDYRPAGWRCNAVIDGADTLRKAQSRNNGVILWIAHFVYNGLPLKKALSEADFPVFHMSRPEHGFSTTAYGVAVLNPLRSRIEERYLARRIMIKRGAEHVALREAHRLLGDGNIVSITAGHWEGRQVARVPVGTATLPVSTGAPSLAHATGAPLLPVFIRREGDGSFRLRIGEALACDTSLPRGDAVAAAMTDFSRQLNSEIARSPDQWRGWKYLGPQS
ncbi:hypothetical protein [Aestuariivirga sp.]|uniref:LpxL/LpxP family acyltransferase n=1 Tax=Aestuariivirga sp. TaxID=2650926 RepID=UPI0035AF5557